MNHSIRFFAALALVLCGTTAWALEPGTAEAPPESVPVAFTMDDLGITGSDVVEKIAKALRDAGVGSAHAFVIGARVQDGPDNEEGVRVWLRNGYQIGNHTFNHEGYEDVSTAFFEEDILANEPVLKQFGWPAGDERWFRFPHLAEGETVEKRQAMRQFLRDQDYRIAQVTVDFADWLFDPAYARCLKQGREGKVKWLKQIYIDKATRSLAEAERNSVRLFGRPIPQIFLVHYSRFTAEVMPDLLKGLKENRARFISLKEAQSDPVFDMDFGIALPHGENFLNSFLLARFPPVEATAGPARGSAWKTQVKNACSEEPAQANGKALAVQD